MKTLKFFVSLTFLSLLFIAIGTKVIFASPVASVCYCHNIHNSPQTLCFQSSIPGHEGHVASGFDTKGVCPTPPVPEFGMITGAVAFITSLGAFITLRKRI